MKESKQIKYFESQQPDEEMVFLVRRHIIELVPMFMIALLGYTFGLYAIIFLPESFPVLVNGFAYNLYVLVVSLIFLFNTIFVFYSWLLHYLHVTILTTEHFVEINQYGPFRRKVSVLTLDRIQDVTNEQNGFIHTIFNLGTVHIQTAGEVSNFVLRYVPNPYKLCQSIMETEEEYSNRHGLRKGYGKNENVEEPDKVK
jgi:uncharacterized membrane protein YdbT with pleckstrin-like domain